MPTKVENKLAILSYHEKRIQLEQEVQQRFDNLSEEAQAIIRDVIREFIHRSAMPVHIIYAQKIVEELEHKLFEKNKEFQELSEIHERALTQHNDQLDCTWEKAYTTGMQDTNKRHEAKFKELLQDKENLKAEIAYKPEPIMAELGSFTNTGFMVGNWRNSWKWFSTWAFLLIVFIATVPIPEQFLAVLPEHIRQAVVAAVAIVGWVLRFINQTQPVPLPPVE